MWSITNVDVNPLTGSNTGTMDVAESNGKLDQFGSYISHPIKRNTDKDASRCLGCHQLKGGRSRFSDEVELMGLKPIFSEESHIVRKLFWAFIVLFGIGFACFQIQSQISLYLSWPVNVLVNISHVPEIPFPRVIFCNYNYMKKSAFPQNLTGVDTTDVSGLFEADIANGMYQNVNWEDVYVKFAHQLNETLLDVSTCNTL